MCSTRMWAVGRGVRRSPSSRRENKSIVEVWKEVMQKEVKPGQKYVEIVAFCDNGQESDDMMMDNDVDLPSIFVEV